MIDEDFGDPDSDEDLEIGVPEPTNVIPFPRMRPDEKVAELWVREREAVNQRLQRHYRLRGPLDALDELMRKRQLPTMPWPREWAGLAARCVLYVGEILAVTGPSGGGKTSFAIQIARAAIGAGTPVLWCPLELDDTQVNTRIVANAAGKHTLHIHEQWTREQIAHVLTSIADRWHFVDKCRDLNSQLQAMLVAVQIAKKVYGKPPILIADYLGKLARGAGEPRNVLADAVETIREFTVAEECYTILLSQTSRGNTGMLTGKVELESAADALSAAAETREIEDASSVSIGLNVFKADDAEVLQAHVLVPKARGTGREGREGFEFRKPGGVWKELDHLPPTPGEVALEVKKTKKDRPDRTPIDAAHEINWARKVAAAAKRKEVLLEHLRKSGMVGAKVRDIRRLRGCANAKQVGESLAELEHAGDIVRLARGGWRIVPR